MMLTIAARAGEGPMPVSLWNASVRAIGVLSITAFTEFAIRFPLIYLGDRFHLFTNDAKYCHHRFLAVVDADRGEPLFHDALPNS